MFLRFQIVIFSRQQIILKELFLHVFKSESRHSIGKSLTCDPLLAEQKDCFFNDSKDFFFICKYFIQISSLSYFLSPASADVYAVPVRVILNRMERALADAASAMIAGSLINGKLAIRQLRHADRAVILNLADLAAAALLQIDLGNPLTDNAGIIQIRLHTVIRTSSDSDLELMRQFHFTVAVIESLMDFL